MQMDKNKELLMKEWDGLYTSKEAKMILVGNVEGYKHYLEGANFVVYNKSQTEGRDPLKGKQKSVFLPFDPEGFNFSNIPNKQILFFLNLDEEQVIEKSQAHKITQNFFDKEDAAEQDQIEGHTHPLIINNTPICRYDSLLAMYPDQELPQVVGTDILLLLLNIFKILPDIKVGYNSVGAGAPVNHLHFQLIYSQFLIGSNKLPIETAERSLWAKSTLVNPSEEINLYTVGIVIEEMNWQGTYAWVVSPLQKGQQELEISEITTSLSFIFGMISNELMEFNIPHNVLISDNGKKIFIMMRDFCTPKINYGWLQFSGVIVTNSQNPISQQQIRENREKLRIDEKCIELVKNNVKKHLSGFV